MRSALTLALILLCSCSEAKRANHIVLTEKNTVSLNLPIDSNSAASVQQQLMDRSQRLSPKDPIYLVLNSPGGSVNDGQSIIETAKGLTNPVHTISLFSASMSFIISQYLNARYAVSSATLMSHRAYAGGLEGFVPGNLDSRVNALLSEFRKIDIDISGRAGIPVEQYSRMIQNELWMKGYAAKELNFIDEVVTVSCSKNLRGPGEPSSFSVMGVLTVTVVFDKCPLIQSPLSIKVDRQNALTPKIKSFIDSALFDRANFVKTYGGQY